MPFPIYTNTTVLSAFTGSDENPISEGGLWASYSGWGGAMRRVSNELAGATGSVYNASYITSTYANVEIVLDMPTFAAGSDYIEIQTRISASPTLATWDGYKFTPDAGNAEIWRVTDGAQVTLVATGTVPAWANGDKIGIQSIGTTLGMWRYTGGVWSLITEGTNATYASAGHISVGCYSNLYRFDNLTIGTPAGVGGGGHTRLSLLGVG